MTGAEAEGLTGEQISWLTVSRQIDDQILRIFGEVGDGFYGTIHIELQCQASAILRFKIGTERVFLVSQDQRKDERRTSGPRDGEDRRKD